MSLNFDNRVSHGFEGTGKILVTNLAIWISTRNGVVTKTCQQDGMIPYFYSSVSEALGCILLHKIPKIATIDTGAYNGRGVVSIKETEGKISDDGQVVQDHYNIYGLSNEQIKELTLLLVDMGIPITKKQYPVVNNK